MSEFQHLSFQFLVWWSVAGSWVLVFGDWKLEIGIWKLIADFRFQLSVFGFWFLVGWLSEVERWKLEIGIWKLIRIADVRISACQLSVFGLVCWSDEMDLLLLRRFRPRESRVRIDGDEVCPAILRQNKFPWCN